jgi:hypothetical protein
MIKNYGTLEERIIDYCLEEGILREKLPSKENFEFGYLVEYPPGNPMPKRLSVFQPKDKRFIILQLAIQISEEHIKGFEKLSQTNAKLIYFEILNRTLLSKNILFRLDEKNNRFIISEQLFEDGISMDLFYRTIRKIVNEAILANLLLSDIITGKNSKIIGEKPAEKNEKQGNFQTDLYYT